MSAANLRVKGKFWRKNPIICKRDIGCDALSFIYSFFMNTFPEKDTFDCPIGLFVSMSAVVVDADLWTHQKTFLSSFLFEFVTSIFFKHCDHHVLFPYIFHKLY